MVKRPLVNLARAVSWNSSAQYGTISYTHEWGRADTEGSTSGEIGGIIVGPVIVESSTGQPFFEVWIAVRVHQRL